MSKIRAELRLARGEIDEFEHFHIELNLPARQYRKLKRFEGRIKAHFEVFNELVQQLVLFRSDCYKFRKEVV